MSAARHDGDVSRLHPAASRNDGRSVEGLGQESSTLVDTLVSVVGTADHETLLAVRQILLSAMFPAMQESAREVVLPLFELVTLEARSIEQGLPRLGEKRRRGTHPAGTMRARSLRAAQVSVIDGPS